MPFFHVHFSVLLQEYYTVKIEAESEAMARTKFAESSAHDSRCNSNFEYELVINTHMERVIENNN